MSENICIGVAERRVSAYANESDSIINQHHEAMDCRACEEFLQQGIDAFVWIKESDKFLREADYQGVSEYTPERQKAIACLYEKWLETCKSAQNWIDRNLSRGFEIDDLDKLRQSCEEVEEIIQNQTWIESAKRASLLSSVNECEQ